MDRTILRIELFRKRRNQFGFVRCIGCGFLVNPQKAKLDLHEVLVTKGDVMKCGDVVKDMINDPRNCAFIEQKCHRTNREQQVSALVEFEGKESVLAFLDELVLAGVDPRVLTKHYNLVKGA